VVSVFGIFFVPDMPALAADFWRMLRPGGVLAVTTWGPRPFEPGAAAFWEGVAAVRTDLVRAFSPWEELVTPDALAEVLARGGVEGIEAEAEDGAADADADRARHGAQAGGLIAPWLRSASCSCRSGPSRTPRASRSTSTRSTGT
jgi:hypothetical protein